MTWLILLWSLSVGYIPLDSKAVVNPDVGQLTSFHTNAISTELSVTAEVLKHLRFFAGVETLAIPQSYTSYVPFEAYYTIGASLYTKNLELGIKHECDHGVESSVTSLPWYGSNSTEVYLKLTAQSSF